MEVFDELALADGIVFGSPIYFGQFTGQMRLFLDRCYSLINADFSPRLPAGKKAVIIGSQGAPDAAAFKGAYDEFRDQISSFMRMDVKDTIIGIGYHVPGEVKDNIELMEKAKNTGFNLFK
jgi:multimeric flavodoxin WrbA